MSAPGGEDDAAAERQCPEVEFGGERSEDLAGDGTLRVRDVFVHAIRAICKDACPLLWRDKARAGVRAAQPLPFVGLLEEHPAELRPRVPPDQCLPFGVGPVQAAAARCVA